MRSRQEHFRTHLDACVYEDGCIHVVIELHLLYFNQNADIPIRKDCEAARLILLPMA